MKKPQVPVVLVPLGLGCAMLSFVGVALAAPRSNAPVADVQTTPVKSVANCCHDLLSGAVAKRDGETRAQCAPQVADVDQVGGPGVPEPATTATLHQTVNAAKPGR